ncbi:fimbria/pilus periplasmic chaperone [Pantoea vagans]|uniref:fimbria/pilus periplasmic chaperone n=1 Tax=Pantoea vagans TaxID=470934 RepID=UPI00225AE048|nr:fimbria/pilus periplasmic chaperone [Pantoea vagans]MCX3308254.1 fimbria/pilus periplasmic chaperone [Pantoea vagans]
MTRITNAAVISAAILCTLNLARGENAPLINELQSFSVKTGATRIIYSPGSQGASLTVMNPQGYPMLVQSEIFMEDQKTRAPFIVTPPLFRLDGHQQSRIKIIATSSHDYDTKESLHWLCLTGIPPEADDEWTDEAYKKKQTAQHATLLTQLRIKSCLKLIVRPSSLKGTPDDFASSLTWVKTGKTLTVTNPTPFFINLKSVLLGKESVNNLDYVPPMGKRELDMPSSADGPVHWRLITDYGGDSQEFTSTLN